ncbi:S9 family peptidase [Persicobacter psychrovividus]|uniref:Peptidase S9 n=1 Tax=Persicobacter psychrovividus TaxID=387638 RepID=A0ABM7VBX4_9BACT|nr:peptidase S9 [Persicobacter psychrovividus]
MTKRLFKLLPVLLLIAGSVFAQKKTLDLKTSIVGAYSELYPNYTHQLQWVKGGNDYSFTKENTLYTQGKKGEKAVITLEELQASNSDLSGLKRLPLLQWYNPKTLSFSVGNAYYKLSLENKKAEKWAELPPEAANIEVAPTHDAIAYTLENNLYVLKNGQSVAVTTEKDKAIVSGQVPSRNEFGIEHGAYWSKDGQQLAFYKKDESKVTMYPLVDITTMPAKEMPIRYPMAGQGSEYVQLGVYHLNTQKTVFAQVTGPRDQYITNVTFGPENKFIYCGILDRPQNHVTINRYSLTDGALDKTLFDEKDEKYGQWHHPLYFVPNHPNEFLWVSERDGFEHLYRYNTSGKLLNQVTEGDWMITDFVGFDKSGRKAIVVGTDNFGMDREVYVSDIRKAGQKKITKHSGVYSVKYNKHNQELIATFSSNTEKVTRQESIISLSGKTTQEILKSDNPMDAYQVSKPELFQITAADGQTPLNCRIIKPSNFDPNKKYPVLVYTYNGPGVQLITNRYNAAASTWMYVAAERGYIVFTVDGRGSHNRGKAFKQATWKHLGKAEVADQLKGVEWLKEQPYVNADKMAIHGWSFGGFMTTSLMLKAPGVFKVGVAGGPVMDWKYYEVMYTERYMQTPQTNPEGYAEASLLDKTQNLKDPLLVVIGSVDPVVVPQHSMQFLKNCVDNDVKVDFFSYPMHEHNVRGKNRVHLYQKVLDYIDDHLK